MSPEKHSNTLRSGLCAPAVCSHDETLSEIVPLHLQVFFQEANLARPELADARIVELSSWSRVPIDFVIAGDLFCGTTTLFQNLARHPEIGFTSSGEDPALFSWRSLPTMDEVSRMNARRRDLMESGKQRPRIVGLDNPMMLRSPFVRQVLARIPRLVVLVISCDPVLRFAKWGARRAQSDGHELDLESYLEASPLAEQIVLVGRHLKELHGLIGSRLVVVHQDYLRREPYRLFDALARRLGVGPFPQGMQLHRYNSHSLPDTGLCRNASLLQAMVRRFSFDYEMIKDMLVRSGMPVPDGVRLRTGHCESPGLDAEDLGVCPVNDTRMPGHCRL